MTTTFQQIENWIVTEEGKFKAEFESEEAKVIAYLQPLIAQIVTTAKTLAVDDFDAGLKILKDSATAAVTAGAPLILQGNIAGAESAAEQAFLATGAAEGVTAVNNAEAATIKAAVAIAQQGVANINGVETPVETSVEPSAS